MGKEIKPLSYFTDAKKNKTNWIRAIQYTMEHYKQGTHSTMLCALCELASGEANGSCINCLFGKGSAPCSDHLTFGLDIRLNFWKKAIKYLHSIPAKDFMDKIRDGSIAEELDRIDNETYKDN